MNDRPPTPVPPSVTANRHGDRSVGRSAGRALPIIALLAIVPLALFVVGGLYVAQPWGSVCLGTGLLSAAVLGLCAAQRLWIEAVYGVLLVVAAGMVVGGAILPEVMLLAGGLVSVVLVGVSAPIAMSLRGWRGSPHLASRGPRDPEGPATNEMSQLDAVLAKIHENTMLSEGAKRVLFRERELGLLRNAIETDLERGAYSAALTLCEQMAEVFGYREEAEAFRGRIEQARQDRYHRGISEALQQLDELLARRDWGMVHREAARIRRLFGDSHLVEDLEQRILLARDEHKRELETRFLGAAEAEDVSGAMALLRELDRYLAPDEAERLAEVAQGIVVRHRENLGVSFKLAVNERRWGEAARVGGEIVNEFPNTKMADEVRGMIDVLRMRATQAALAGSEQSP